MRDLLKRLLTVEPEKRITMEEVLKHSWCFEGRFLEPAGGGSGPRAKGPLAAAATRHQVLGADPSTVHDSVKLVLPSSLLPSDPISAAIMRGQESSSGAAAPAAAAAARTAATGASPARGAGSNGRGGRASTDASDSRRGIVTLGIPPGSRHVTCAFLGDRDSMLCT